MHRTHLSLYYLAGYLLPAGLLLLTVPEFARKLLLSNRDYDDAPFRLVGVLLIVLGIIIVQIIRHRIEALYTTTVVARVLISLTLIAIYIETSDPFFLVILAIVVLGIALTTWSYLTDRRDRATTIT
ncbi:MAG: hypothetical protein QOJ75_714 [Chloroflexota bacterium]|jgi:uncharacterized protein YjeT (DUF2065 family)|nr:hypothetical protein [Chloroflexota bacterium]